MRESRATSYSRHRNLAHPIRNTELPPAPPKWIQPLDTAAASKGWLMAMEVGWPDGPGYRCRGGLSDGAVAVAGCTPWSPCGAAWPFTPCPG